MSCTVYRVCMSRGVPSATDFFPYKRNRHRATARLLGVSSRGSGRPMIFTVGLGGKWIEVWRRVGVFRADTMCAIANTEKRNKQDRCAKMSTPKQKQSRPRRTAPHRTTSPRATTHLHAGIPSSAFLFRFRAYNEREGRQACFALFSQHST